MGSVNKPVKSPAGRILKAGDLKRGQIYEVDVRTNRIVPPKKPRPK